MGVVRFRTMDQARAALACKPGSREHLKRLAALWQRAWSLAPRSFPRGVQRFRSIEEANRERQQRLIAFMRALRGQRLAAAARRPE